MSANLLTANALSELAQLLPQRYKFLTPGVDEHNNYGFRDHEIITDVDICYYGCSITYGAGVDLKYRWTSVIDDRLRYQSNNFGIPGIGIDEILSLFVITSQFVKMKKAIFLIPSYYRQYIDGYNIFPNKHNQSAAADIWYRLPLNYFEDRAVTSIQLIRRMADMQNIQCILTSDNLDTLKLLSHNSLSNPIEKRDRLGSDNLHPGPRWHRLLAEQFIEIL